MDGPETAIAKLPSTVSITIITVPDLSTRETGSLDKGTRVNGHDAVELYWSGGRFHAGLVFGPGRFPPNAVAKAVVVLEEFRAECHKAYFAFNGTLNGRLTASSKYEKLLTKREARIYAGSAPPDGEQRPGQSVIAELTQGQLLDALVAGGDFEDRQNKALLVMLFHRWEEWYRHRIAEALGVDKDDVRCILMGEVRLLRNLIVHENAMVRDASSIPILSHIWEGIGAGYLVITDRMIHALMEQLNAIRVEIAGERQMAGSDTE